MRITIRQLVADDTTGLMGCFQRCYGESYANELFYDEAKLYAAISAGQLRSVVAVHDDVVVGHTGLTIRYDSTLVPEAGNTVVDPAMRGQGLLSKLGNGLRELTLREGFVGYVHYPTTAHEIMQKSATSGTGRETGIMLGYVPAETDYLDINQPRGRLAATIVYQPLAEIPAARIHVPNRYVSLIRSFAGSLGILREISASPIDEEAATATDFSLVRHHKRGLVSMQVATIGSDLSKHVDALPDVAAFLSPTNA